jgi:hypothetical protein
MSSGLCFLLLTLTLIAMLDSQIVNSNTIWGTCASFSVHAGTAVSFNGGTTAVQTGNIGVSPGTSISGSYTNTGNVDNNDAAAINCAADKLTAYNTLKNLTCPPSNLLAASDLSGLTLLPGVWCSASGDFTLSTTTLTLNGGGDTNSVWVFQTASTLITSTATSFILENGANSMNIYWAIGSSATLGSASAFVGQIDAGVSVSVGTGTTLNGRAFAAAAVSFAGGDTCLLPAAIQPTMSPTTITPVATSQPALSPLSPVAALSPSSTSQPTSSGNNLNLSNIGFFCGLLMLILSR